MRYASSAVVYSSVIVTAVVPATLALAQPVAGKSQPDRLNFGCVHVGAIAEGSVRVFQEGNDTAGVAFKVHTPAFAEVKNTELGTQTYGNSGTKIVLDVSLALNTDRVGEYSGSMHVVIGTQRSSIPIKVNVLPHDSSATRVLVVETPFDKFSTGDASVFDPWLALVESAKLDVHYLDVIRKHPILRDIDLSDFDVILLGETGLIFLLENDVAKLKEFVNEGGRLIISANAFYQGTVERANELLTIAGLSMTDTEPRGTSEFDLKGDDIANDPLTDGVGMVRCFRPSPIAVVEGTKGKVLISAPPYPGQGFVAAGRHGKGEVIALGQSLWWNWVGGAKYEGSDNRQLLLNLVIGRGIRK